MWTKSACWGVQLIGLTVIVFGFLVLLAGSVELGILFLVGGLGLIVLGAVKIRQRLRR